MAYDLTVHKDNIKQKAIRQIDFANHSGLAHSATFEQLLVNCEIIVNEGFKKLKLARTVLYKKDVYKITSFEHELVLRLISKNIRRLTGVRQTNRNSIVRSLKVLFQEGLDYNVFKFDVKNFYESIDVKNALSRLEADNGFSRSHLRLLESFFAQLENQGINGLPRGLAISATLAEYVMRRFDESLSQENSIFFYERFVDDIIIVTHPNVSNKFITKIARNSLPNGLKFNKNKTKSLVLNESVLNNNENNSIHKQVDFLGYTFNIFKRKKHKNSPISRNVLVDISNSKTKKIKTKIIKSLIEFCEDGNFSTLENRLKLLSGNYTIFDHGRGIRRKAGIFFNYSIVDPDDSESLKELDLFLKKIILSKNGRLCSKLNVQLTNTQKRKLLKHSFLNGFKHCVFYNFSGSQIVDLMRCWAYV